MVGIKAIANLIPIYIHLKKLQGRFYLRGFLLSSNHIIKSIINISGSNEYIAHHHLSFNKLVKIIRSGLHFFLFFCLIFIFFWIYFSIFRTIRIRVRGDWSHCHISHNLMVWSQH